MELLELAAWYEVYGLLRRGWPPPDPSERRWPVRWGREWWFVSAPVNFTVRDVWLP